MTDVNTFPELVARIQAGDRQAATEFMQIYWPQAERMARVWMTDSRLGPRLGLSDVCQDALWDLYKAIASGHGRPQTASELSRTLAEVVRKRSIDQARKHKAARRDVRRTEPIEVCRRRIVAAAKTPSSVVADREIVHKFRSHLSDEERLLFEQRQEGRTWDEIGWQVGKTPGAVRRQHDRALRRVRKELELTDA